MHKIIWGGIAILMVLGLLYIGSTTGPSGEDMSQSIPSQGQDHIDEGAEHPPYNSNPPTSGWHYASPAEPGFYREPLPDERIVHNLEHGHIWIAYHPDLEEAFVSELRTFASPWVIITPRDANEKDIALAAWTRLDTFDVDGEPSMVRIEDFIKRYTNRAPEKVGPSPTFKK